MTPNATPPCAPNHRCANGAMRPAASDECSTPAPRRAPLETVVGGGSPSSPTRSPAIITALMAAVAIAPLAASPRPVVTALNPHLRRHRRRPGPTSPQRRCPQHHIGMALVAGRGADPASAVRGVGLVLRGLVRPQVML